MGKLVFSSDHLPPELSDAQRFGLWRDLFCQNIAHSEFWVSDAPFRAHMEYVALGTANLARMSGSIVRSRHGQQTSLPGAGERVGLLINQTPALIQLHHRKRETLVPARGAVLISLAEAGELTSDTGQNDWFILDLPAPGTSQGLAVAQDAIGKAIGPELEALALIRGYASLLMSSGALDPLLSAHIARTMTDLAGLALGLQAREAETATARGLAAARLDAIVREIARGCANAEFNVAMVAARLRLSERYVQKLLHATGTSFTERVLELRLQRACELLARAGSQHRKISDIALEAGFSDVSYFHSTYRRRFGMTPGGARGN